MGSDEVGIIIGSVNKMADTLLSRVESTERDFINHLQKVEERLDQLVDLTRTVAVLQTEASHRDDHIDELKNSIKRINERIDDTKAKHTELDDRVKSYFKIGSGMWIVLVAWFFVYQPVDVLKKANESINALKEEVKDINAWRFGQEQQQTIRKR